VQLRGTGEDWRGEAVEISLDSLDRGGEFADAIGVSDPENIVLRSGNENIGPPSQLLDSIVIIINNNNNTTTNQFEFTCVPNAGRTSSKALSKSAEVTTPFPSDSIARARAKLAALRTKPANSAPEKCSVRAPIPSSSKFSMRSMASRLNASSSFIFLVWIRSISLLPALSKIKEEKPKKND
jgi:hypothetical protein